MAGGGAPPPLRGVLEVGLYVEDVARATDFYTALFGFGVLFRDGRMAALDVRGRQVLLLFRRGASAEATTLAGGVLPGHDGSGTSHFAFAVGPDDVPAWEAWLGRHEVAVESRVAWPRGGTSLYFRDPDGHLLEVLTPGVWETY